MLNGFVRVIEVFDNSNSLSLNVIMAVWWNIIISINGVGRRTNVFPARLDVIPLAYIAIKNTPIIFRYASQINHKSAHKSITKSGFGLLVQTVRPSS